MKNTLTVIPGVGKSITDDLNNLGIYRVGDLKDKNPELLYRKVCKHQGMMIDRCMLYVMRCVVYFVSHKKHDPELLKWWKWKD